jgi:hypothetical protein
MDLNALVEAAAAQLPALHSSAYSTRSPPRDNAGDETVSDLAGDGVNFVETLMS